MLTRQGRLHPGTKVLYLYWPVGWWMPVLLSVRPFFPPGSFSWHLAAAAGNSGQNGGLYTDSPGTGVGVISTGATDR